MHFVRNLTIFTVVVCFVAFLIMGIANKMEIFPLLVMLSITIVLGSLLAWLISKTIYKYIVKEIYDPKYRSQVSQIPSKGDEASIEFNLKFEEIKDATPFIISHSPTYIRTNLILRYLFISITFICILAAIFLFVLINQEITFLIVMLSVMAFVFFILFLIYPLWFKNLLIRSFKLKYLGPQNQFVGIQKISANSKGLIHEKDSFKKIIPWQNVIEIHTGKNTLVIFLIESDPLIVPRKAFGAIEEFDRFIDTIQIYFQSLKK